MSEADCQPAGEEPDEWTRFERTFARLTEEAGTFPTPSSDVGLRGPDFLCIGAAKTGTSWLYDVLRRHPAIWLPPIKEISYFTSHYIAGGADFFAPRRAQQLAEERAYWDIVAAEPDARLAWDRARLPQMLPAMAHLALDSCTDDWYADIFRFRGPDQVAGDISPDYALLPRAGVHHLLRMAPDAKIIIILRDPVERLLSHAAMHLPRGGTIESLEELVHSDDARDWRMVSDYAHWLPKWTSAIDPSRLLFTYTGRIGRVPHAVLEDICRFLGVPFDADVFPGAMRKVYEGEKPKNLAVLAAKLNAEFMPQREALRRAYPEIAAALEVDG